MTLLHTLIHPQLKTLNGKVLERLAARAIVLHGDEILLLHTRRYNDYSFPGGGLNAGEDIVSGLHRELQEETGARNIQVLRHYGYVEEYRPYHKPEYDLMFMRSHFYLCQTDRELGSVALEPYEEANGMTAQWINIHSAIAHNEQVIAEKPAGMGLSIGRETLMLKHVMHKLL
jgi:8-oxo-dGTP pyrophosphatase MutT (NUDIX family)